ncbi:TetR/AcrR family transcriptional regulator [Microbacterium sp. P01]|uniref:TetR/AcrR family transcriptional regulator n=1 Tax=Microbacterium sp. P01 TaxID=3366261 RepID=UPI00366EC2BD
MASSSNPVRSRKRPEERREEILSAAASIALDEGLERITLRAVADRLGVRPGLITHYFPAVEDLVVEAFARAAEREREQFFPAGGTPMQRLRHFIDYLDAGASMPLARLWLNARHLSRFSSPLEAMLEQQDDLDQARLIALIEEGVRGGDFADVDAAGASIRIFLAIDGGGSYVNSRTAHRNPVHRHFAADVAEWTLGLARGTLRPRALDADPAARSARS